MKSSQGSHAMTSSQRLSKNACHEDLSKHTATTRIINKTGEAHFAYPNVKRLLSLSAQHLGWKLASISLLLHDSVFFFYISHSLVSRMLASMHPRHRFRTIIMAPAISTQTARWHVNVLLRSLDKPEILFPFILLAVSESVLADIVAKAKCRYSRRRS